MLARVEARQKAADLIGAHFIGGLGAVGCGAQPKGAEIAQFDDITLCQFLGNDGEEGLDGGNEIRLRQRGPVSVDRSAATAASSRRLSRPLDWMDG